MKKMNKKGFTIVELVIVIAVIAILAAVLIPTFTGIIKKANISADTQLVRNLNTALAEDKAINGEHKTMQSALDAAVEGGYIVARINAKATGNEILWDSVADAFCYLNDGKVEYTPDVTGEKAKDNEKYKLWKIDSVPSDVFSTYLYNIGETTTFNVTTGIDVGNENVTSISYVRTSADSVQDVVIRTNGGTLTINAPADTVKHYGEAQVVTLTAVGTSSYYEHGSVNLVDIKKGRLVITNDTEAEVATIYLSATGDAYDEIIIATQSGSKLPDVVAREEVSNPTIVVTIQTNVDANGENPTKTEEIKLNNANDVKEATNGYAVSDLGLLVVEAISAEAQTEAADQITDATVLDNVKESNVATKDEIVAAATEFAGGKGTEANPWLIVDYDTMQAISNHYNDDVQRYFKVKDGITEIDCSNWNSVKLYGHFDGNGVTFKNVDDILFNSIYQNASSDETAVIKNFSIEAYIVRSSYSSALVYSLGEKVDFSNINVTGYIEGSYTASFVSFGPWQFDGLNTATWTFNNCNSSAMLCGTDGAAGFVNHSFCAVGSTARLTNSKFTGEMRLIKTINSTSKNDYNGGTDGHITSEINAYNTAYYFQCMGNLVFEENFTDGTDVSSLHYYKWTNKTTQDTKQASVLCNRERVTLAPLTNKTQLNTNGVEVITVDATNPSVTHAKAVLFIGPNDAANETGGYYSAWLTEELALNNGQFTTNTIKTFKIAINGLFYDWTDNTWKEPAAITDKNTSGIYGDYYNMALSSFYGRTYAQKSVTIIQYNSLNQVVSKTSVNFAVSTNLNVTDYTGNNFNSSGSVASVTAAKRAVYGTNYTLALQDSTLGTNDLIVKLGNVVLTAGTDYSVENGNLTIYASALQQSTYTERNVTVYRKLTVTVNDKTLENAYQNQTAYNITVTGLTTSNKANLVVKVNGITIAEGSGRYTVAANTVKLDAKIMTGNVTIEFTIPQV